MWDTCRNRKGARVNSSAQHRKNPCASVTDSSSSSSLSLSLSLRYIALRLVPPHVLVLHLISFQKGVSTVGVSAEILRGCIASVSNRDLSKEKRTKMSSLGTSKGILEIGKFAVYVAVPIGLMYFFANNSKNLQKIMGNRQYVVYPPEAPRPPSPEEIREIAREIARNRDRK